MSGRGRIILIGGGVRSGKSALALERAGALGSTRAFIATAQAFDREMETRILHHREERGEMFETVEAPHELERALLELPERIEVVVVDCLTLWLSNLLLADLTEARIRERVARLAAVLERRDRHVVMVTNEVGMGIVPETALGRMFRDVAGRAHQDLARISDEIIFACLGVALRLKPGPIELASPGGPNDELE